jgi:hypothetical protein
MKLYYSEVQKSGAMHASEGIGAGGVRLRRPKAFLNGKLF